MQIGVLGLNHHTAPIELRERLAFQVEELPAALNSVRQDLNIEECVILSTCNRVELYTVTPQMNGHEQDLKGFLAQFHRLEPEALDGSSPLGGRLYWYLQPDSVRHLFRVAAGLDSMVVGESEILGQVKEAYQQAVANESVGPIFHRLFQTALRTGKEVRAKTRIGQGATSVSSVAVELAHRIFQNLKTKTVLVLGAGQMGENTLHCLRAHGVGDVLLANRTLEAAFPLAQTIGGQVIPLQELERALLQADIVICSAGADHFLMTESQVRRAMAIRRQRPLFLIDISVPRNLDPKIGLLENVYLYDIDDLEGIASTNLQIRLKEIEACSTIIEQRLDAFLKKVPGTAAA